MLAAAMLYMDEALDEEDILAIYSELTRKNPVYPYWKNNRIELQLADISQAEFKAEFRFGMSEIELLADSLKIPDNFVCVNGTVASGLEGLLMFLKRFSYPCRLSDMIPRFGRSVPEMSLILSEVTEHIVGTHGHLLERLDQPWLQPLKLENYAQAISRKGAALDNCWGFIDGTVRPISRPGEHQRTMYNGHKRIHAIKFQSVVTPDGMIANLYGPVGKHSINIICLPLGNYNYHNNTVMSSDALGLIRTFNLYTFFVCIYTQYKYSYSNMGLHDI